MLEPESEPLCLVSLITPCMETGAKLSHISVLDRKAPPAILSQDKPPLLDCCQQHLASMTCHSFEESCMDSGNGADFCIPGSQSLMSGIMLRFLNLICPAVPMTNRWWACLSWCGMRPGLVHR